MRLLFRRAAVFACLPLAATVLTAQDTNEALTLRRAVELALERNPAVSISREQLVELDGKIKEVKSGAFPELTLQGFGLRLRDPSILNSSSFDNLPPEFRDALVPTPSNLFDVNVGVKQTVYSAGKVRNGILLAEAGRRQREDDLETARREVTFRVFEAFNAHLLAIANLEVVEETREQKRRQLELARDRYRLGVATEIDVLRSEVDLANTEPELIRAENGIRLTRSNINNLIVRDLESPTKLVGKLSYNPWKVPSLDELVSDALETRPEVLAARHVVAQNRILQALADSEKKLGVDLAANWGYNVRDPKNLFNNDYTRWNVTLNFKLPFYDGGRKAGLLIQAGARLRASEASLQQLENNVRLEIKSAMDDLRSAEQAIEAATLNSSQAQKVLEMMQANYRYGAATTLDVVDSQTALTLARNTVIRATYLYEVSKARLRLAAGRPILDEEAIR